MRFLPEIILTIVGTLLMVLDPLFSKALEGIRPSAIVALLAAMARPRSTPTDQPEPIFGGMLIVDGFATFFRVLVMLVGILAILPSLPVSWRGKRRRRASITRCCCSRSPASASWRRPTI